MIEILKENWGLITGATASTVAFFGGKRMKEISEKQANSDALTSISDLYDKLVLQMNQRFQEQESEIKKLKITLKEYIDQCSKCSNNKL